MTKEQEKYIRENRLSYNMKDLAINLGLPKKEVEYFMTKNDLKVSAKEKGKIVSLKKKRVLNRVERYRVF